MSTKTPVTNASTKAAVPPSTWSLIAWPAILTLIVTAVRLFGELQDWPPRYFNKEGGGGGAIVGIVWLAPIFGIWFARRLVAAGQGPANRGPAIVWPLVALLLMVGGFAAILKFVTPSAQLIFAIQATALVCAALGWQGWPQLARVNFAYGLAARIPVAILMLIAMNAGWGTHYEKGPPGLPEYPLLQKWFLTGALPQLILWVSFTILAGGLFGGLSLLFGRKERAAPVRAPTAAPQAH